MCCAQCHVINRPSLETNTYVDKTISCWQLVHVTLLKPLSIYLRPFCTVIQSSLYKCYPYKRYNFIYVKKILLPYKNTIGKTSECYVLSVITCSTPFFVNCTSISVNFEKNKVIIYESTHFKHVITFIPYSLQTSQIFSLI